MERHEVIEVFAILDEKRVLSFKAYRNAATKSVNVICLGNEIKNFFMGRAILENSPQDFKISHSFPFDARNKKQNHEVKKALEMLRNDYFEQACEFYEIPELKAIWVQVISQTTIAHLKRHIA